MSRQNPASPEMRAPEFLRTHPVTTARIAEARNRAQQYPRRMSTASVEYGISRARVIVARFDTAPEAVAYFEQRSYENQTQVERYGRALAYQRAGLHLEANRIFGELVEKDPRVIAYHVDLYRVSDEEELRYLGWNELDSGFRLVEWPDRAPSLAQAADVAIDFAYSGEGRRVDLEGLNERGAAALGRLRYAEKANQVN